MNEEERKRAIDELRHLLLAGGEISVLFQGDPVSEKVERICEKCKSSVSSTILGHEGIFVRCSVCGYPVWLCNYIRVPDSFGRLPWYYIEDVNGNTEKDFNGNLRLFESADVARKYLICCNLDSRKFNIKYYGKVTLY